ncbi:endonuclease/exonuclease/phosphatase family protein [Balneicella halophila]|nr:endonuclease/exonuclease/phosphatase family protein [Balneicella halophila]
MQALYYSIVFILVLVSLLPFLHSKHWTVRICDFLKVHLFFWLPAFAVIGFFIVKEQHTLFWIVIWLLVILTVYHGITLLRYTPLFKLIRKDKREIPKNSKEIKLLSFNVYQYSKKYDKLLKLIDEIKPDIILTIESNSEWQNALRPIEKTYLFNVKVPLENTYGMHLYSRLPIGSYKVHYHVSDDLPSIEAKMQSPDGQTFTFYGVHPPPPSPTEEETSKERDGELMAIANSLKNRTKESFLVVGDFNNVAWARSSRLFRKATGLIDPREGRGLIASFHAKYRMIRVPIDLLFHSNTIFIKTLKRLREIGSDHFPIYCEFYVENGTANNDRYKLSKSEKQEMKEDIIEGKQEEGNR